ncbi:hypothetical protein LCGC14_2752030 [marine sediment metagenome]|uniref:Uncharacterized protein n=1 Tax=marine sediment metagenome TaxID=412755 RepID=A0A0F8ZNH8_9ZZZZ
MRAIFAVLIGLTVSSCQDAAYLHQASRNFVIERHTFRQWIRAECRASLVRDLEKLQKEGNESGVRALLAANYPGLVTFDIIDAARQDLTGTLSKPSGCMLVPLTEGVPQS